MEAVPKFRFIYKIVDCDNSILDGISIDFRANSRTKADKLAVEKAALFGIYARAKFIKQI